MVCPPRKLLAVGFRRRVAVRNPAQRGDARNTRWDASLLAVDAERKLRKIRSEKVESSHKTNRKTNRKMSRKTNRKMNRR